jgi:hypothetical protein
MVDPAKETLKSMAAPAFAMAWRVMTEQTLRGPTKAMVFPWRSPTFVYGESLRTKTSPTRSTLLRTSGT